MNPKLYRDEGQLDWVAILFKFCESYDFVYTFSLGLLKVDIEYPTDIYIVVLVSILLHTLCSLTHN